MNRPNVTDSTDEEKDLQLTRGQYEDVRDIWHALEELWPILPTPDSSTGPLICLKVVSQQYAAVLRGIVGRDLL